MKNGLRRAFSSLREQEEEKGHEAGREDEPDDEAQDVDLHDTLLDLDREVLVRRVVCGIVERAADRRRIHP